MKRTGIICAVLLIWAGMSFAQTPESIIRRSREVMTVKSFEAYSTLIIRNSRGNERIRKNTMASKSYPDGSEKRVIKFTAPPEVAGTGILIFDYEDKSDDMWIYLPAMRQTRRVVSSEKSKSFMGSEFSNADMTAPAIQDFNYKNEGESTIDGNKCIKIESVPKNEDLCDEYGYSRAVSYINKADFIVLLTEYYNFEGELYKTIKTIKYQLVDKDNGKYMVTDMLADNLKNGRNSEMVMDKIQQADTDENYFTVTWLEKN